MMVLMIIFMIIIMITIIIEGAGNRVPCYAMIIIILLRPLLPTYLPTTHYPLPTTTTTKLTHYLPTTIATTIVKLLSI